MLGVGQRGRRGADHVVYKLYVHPEHRGRGLGPRLRDAAYAGEVATTIPLARMSTTDRTRRADASRSRRSF
jgi:GNAT superfamily N-acetyltransferase